jgi:peptidoglycan/xylan/chitin deacetylase (PgdA/CDA1 family)
VALAPPASPSAAPSGAPATSPAANPYLAMVPKFDPPPAPQPIALPGGPVAPIFHRLPVQQRVAFLTMDDGQVQLPEAIPLMQAAHIRFTMFLIAPVAAKNPSFFRQLVAAGGVIEDHTITHPEMPGKSYAFQRHEVCDAKTSLEQTFGTNLRFFRPPYGDYEQTTLRAVHDCGLTAAFHWSETVNDGKVFYQTADHHIAAGDIILMHFRPAFVQDVLAALTAIHDAGLTPALLEDYL